MQAADVHAVLNKPISQELLRSEHLVRLAYTGLDGFPRVIPVAFIWDDGRFIVCTATNAPKAAAISKNPEVALVIDTDTHPPRVLLLRGSASIDIVEGVPEEFLAANRKVEEPGNWVAFEEQMHGLYDQMARISISIEWAKLIDFETTVPTAVEEIVKRKQAQQL